jgi:hypothetical protein
MREGVCGHYFSRYNAFPFLMEPCFPAGFISVCKIQFYKVIQSGFAERGFLLDRQEVTASPGHQHHLYRQKEFLT